MSTYYSTTIDSKNILFLHRAIIAKSLNDNAHITKIAEELGFSRQTIHNEIARETIEHKKTDLTIEYVYDFSFYYLRYFVYDLFIQHRVKSIPKIYFYEIFVYFSKQKSLQEINPAGKIARY